MPISAVALFLALMSFARIYSGQHWPSDVLAGCLLGGLWLVVVVGLYVWGERRVAARRPGRIGSAWRGAKTVVMNDRSS